MLKPNLIKRGEFAARTNGINNKINCNLSDEIWAWMRNWEKHKAELLLRKNLGKLGFSLQGREKERKNFWLQLGETNTKKMNKHLKCPYLIIFCFIIIIIIIIIIILEVYFYFWEVEGTMIYTVVYIIY